MRQLPKPTKLIKPKIGYGLIIVFFPGVNRCVQEILDGGERTAEGWIVSAVRTISQVEVKFNPRGPWLEIQIQISAGAIRLNCTGLVAKRQKKLILVLAWVGPKNYQL